MPRRKVASEPEENKPVEPQLTEEQQELKKIDERELSDIIGEQIEIQGDELVVADKENDVEKKAKEEEKEYKKEELPKKEEEKKEETKAPDFDAEKLAETITDKVISRLPKNEQAQAKKDVKEELAAWVEEKRNPSYEEALEFMMNKSVEKVLSVIDEREAKRSAEQKEKEEVVKKQEEAEQMTQKDYQERFDKWFDERENKLIASGKMPPKTEENAEIWKDFHKTMVEINQELVKKGEAHESDPVVIFHEYYQKPENKQPAGANAPVSVGSGGGVMPQNEQSYSYKDIQRMR